jgi:hypothetical protein
LVAHPGDESRPRAARRLNEPRPALVSAADGIPAVVNRVRVVRVREEWRVNERWWTSRPLQRRYFDVVLETGENAVVFLDEALGRWFRQRA